MKNGLSLRLDASVAPAENRILQSEDLNVTASAWSHFRVTVSADASGTAERIADTAVAGTHAFRQSVTLTNGPVVFSIEGKAETLRWAFVSINGGANGSYFDFQAGVKGTPSGATATIDDVGDGWYRANVFATYSSATPQFDVYLATANGAALSYTGSGASLLMRKAQICYGTRRRRYVRTTTTGYPA